ncbi:MAG: hypothetical protein WB919_06120 [Candidatus Sulfotelmatobacter sp.]
MAAPMVAGFLQDELGWSETQKQEAVNQYTKKIRRFLEVAGLSKEDSDLTTSWANGFSEARRA